MTDFNLEEIELETFELVDITRTALKDGYVAADFIESAQIKEDDGGSCCSCCSCTSTSSCSSTS